MQLVKTNNKICNNKNTFTKSKNLRILSRFLHHVVY